MASIKTSLQLDSRVLDSLKARYPDLNTSEIVRLAMSFVDKIGPELITDGTRFSLPSSLKGE